MPRRNVHPSAWGRPAWQFLQSCAEACDAPSAPDYEAFVRLLPAVLPCEKCRAHAKRYIAANPPDMQDLKGWLQRFEEHVSQQKRRASDPSSSASSRCEMPSLRGASEPSLAVAVLFLLGLLGLALCRLRALRRP